MFVGKTLEKPSGIKDEDVESLSKWLRDRQRRYSPIQLATVADLAFQVTFDTPKADEKLAKAMARGMSVRQKMAVDEGGSQSAEETARQLGITKQSVLNLYHAGKILAWRTEKQGALRFPAWQFVEDHRLPGLSAVLAELNAARVLDDWGKIGFFLQTHGSLNGRRPLDLLRQKKLDVVLKAAHSYVS
jgi:hypothetical protein